ncbi:MAG: hypothetical protein LC633_00430 [Desulfobulbaceae bacterium]|nr:hypothetical protein [Desulfobulbaceae bacterium]
MEDKRVRIIQWTALLGCIITAAQIAVILFKGEAFCLNQGCRIVENLTTIPPVYFNLAGLVYFLVIFAAARPTAGRPRPGFDWLSTLLLAGLAAEGMLISYQLVVAQTFCAYCLIIELHLFFSSNCPHCLNVLDAMAVGNNCEINFNPIDRLESLDLAELTYFPEYNPAINRLLLSLLDIKTIPVLMAVKEPGPVLIKGERAIIDYINEVCFAAEIDPYTGTSSYGEPAIGFSSDPAPEDECEIEEECPDDPPEFPAPPGK